MCSPFKQGSERVKNVNGFAAADRDELMRDVGRNDVSIARADFVTLAVLDDEFVISEKISTYFFAKTFF